jgi:hypothetical protein
MSPGAGLLSIVPIDLALSRDLTLEELRVMIAMFSFKSKGSDVVWPKRETLAARCGYSANKISHVTSSLVRKGWLKKEGIGGRSTATRYQITTPKTVSHSETVTESETVSHSDTKTVSHSDTKTVSHSVRGIEHTKEHTIEHINQSPTKNSKKATDGFNRFWSAYPLKQSKGQAEKAFAKINPDEPTLQAILSGIDRAKQHDRRFIDGFTPYPSTWLNAKGWEDVYEKPRPSVVIDEYGSARKAI